MESPTCRYLTSTAAAALGGDVAVARETSQSNAGLSPDDISQTNRSHSIMDKSAFRETEIFLSVEGEKMLLFDRIIINLGETGCIVMESLMRWMQENLLWNQYISISLQCMVTRYSILWVFCNSDHLVNSAHLSFDKDYCKQCLPKTGVEAGQEKWSLQETKGAS